MQSIINNSSTFTQLVNGEKVRQLYRSFHTVMIGNIAVSSIMVFGLWDNFSPQQLLTWLGFIYLFVFARIPLNKKYKQQPIDEQNQPRWAYYIIFTSIVSGILWGSAVILFFTINDPYATIFVSAVTLGMISGSTIALSSYTPAHYAFMFPCIAPLCYYFFTSDFEHSTTYGLLSITYLIINMVFSRNFERTFRESIELRFKNTSLVEKLTDEKDKAEAASEAKSRFLASASHDLRQPLHALGLFVGAMEHHTTNHDLNQLVSKTKQSYTALEGLLDVLLDISKLDAGVIQPKPDTISVQSIFDTLQNEFENQAKSKGLELRFHPTTYWTFSDPTLLGRILRNLISNAIRYTGTGCILIGCRYQPDQVIIEVRDTGHGIPEDKLTEIFKEFRQLDNPERDRQKGLGLGLAIVDRLSRLLKHRVEVQSDTGKGSIFKLHLPRAIAQSHVDETKPIPSMLDKLVGLKILAIDDESDILDGMKHLLTGWGCSVSVAETVNEACLYLKNHDWEPDIILVDYRLRNNQTGADAIKLIHDCLVVETPAIIITGDTAPERIQEAKQSGFPILHKPIQPARLRSVLQQQIQRNFIPGLENS